MVTYKVKVRGRTFLWGNDKHTHKMAPNLYLFFRVDERGEPIYVGLRKTEDGSIVEIGPFDPGECYTLLLDTVAGVFADCETDSNVDCVLLES